MLPDEIVQFATLGFWKALVGVQYPWERLGWSSLAIDFGWWCGHYLGHKVDFLWQFHKLHHSVKEMGFAAHLRFHWM